MTINDFIKECSALTTGFMHFEHNKFIKRKIDQNAINNYFSAGSLPHMLLTELLNEDPNGLSTQKALEAVLKNK